MEGRVFDPQVPFHVHRFEADGSLGEYVGGAQDVASASVVAAGLFAASQGYTADSTMLIGVVDDTGTVVAFIGKHPVQVS